MAECSNCVPERPCRVPPCPTNTCNPCVRPSPGNCSSSGDGGGAPVCPCGPMQRYIQPPRRESCKPVIRFSPPTIPIEDSSVYKKSYPTIDAATIAQCRAVTSKPNHCFQISGAPIQNDTVTTLSFPGHCNVPRTRPILPQPPSLLREGRMQEMTTQKHDYVCKPAIRRDIMLPKNCLAKPMAPFENCTTQKLSYLVPDPCNFTPAVSCRPKRQYKCPDQPMDTNTTQQLSYQPVCPAPREQLPWMKRPKYRPPVTPMDKCTTYKLSYVPGDRPQPSVSCKPMIKFSPPTIPMDAWTVYNRSYPNIDAATLEKCRAKTSKPNHCFQISGAQMEKGTVTTMSYPGHCNIPRQRPILPKPPSLLQEGRMQELTTQKHDYVNKPVVKQEIIRPRDNMGRTRIPLESCTINRLSYQPNKENFVPSESCRPRASYQPPSVSMDCNTTNKLSYAAVTVPPRQTYPWMERPKFRPPCAKMDTTTIQQQSYLPPGCFVGDSCGGCCATDCPPQQTYNFPKAAVC